MTEQNSDFAALAKKAYCINDDDWGTERQIEAENAFFAAVKAKLPAPVFEKLEGYCLKATSDEMIEEAMRLLGLPAERETETDLCAEYDAWCAEQKLRPMSADELILEDGINEEQAEYLTTFILRWEAAMERDDAKRKASR